MQDVKQVKMIATLFMKKRDDDNLVYGNEAHLFMI